jgi:2'-5' RNA ligase
MWQRFNLALGDDQLGFDRNINSSSDTRRGVTALAYLQSNNKLVTDNIRQFLNDVKHIEPSQYYYPPNDLHLTILSIITCVKNFTYSDINPCAYQALFLDAFSGINQIEIRFKGITATPECILIQGFPVGDELEKLRQKLRDGYSRSSLRTSIDKRYSIKTAHCTAIRFCSLLHNKHLLKDCLSKYRNHDFGSISLKHFELVFNDWYQRKSNTIGMAQYTSGGS